MSIGMVLPPIIIVYKRNAHSSDKLGVVLQFYSLQIARAHCHLASLKVQIVSFSSKFSVQVLLVIDSIYLVV